MEFLDPAIQQVCKEYLENNLRLEIESREICNHASGSNIVHYIKLVLDNKVISEVFVD